MKREPEENNDRINGDQSPYPFFHFGGGHTHRMRVGSRSGSGQFAGVGQLPFVGQVNDQRNQHGENSDPESKMESGGESAQIPVGKCGHVGRSAVFADRCGELLKPRRSFRRKQVSQETVAQLRQIRVVQESLRGQPAVSHAHGGERRENSSDVDKHVEQRKPRIPHFFVFLVIVHLSYQSL